VQELFTCPRPRPGMALSDQSRKNAPMLVAKSTGTQIYGAIDMQMDGNGDRHRPRTNPAIAAGF